MPGRTDANEPNPVRVPGTARADDATVTVNGGTTNERRDLVGRTLGNFTLVEMIGAGGGGEVFRAEQRELDRTAVIKVLRARAGALTHGTDRLMRSREVLHRDVAQARVIGLVLPDESIVRAVVGRLVAPGGTRFPPPGRGLQVGDQRTIGRVFRLPPHEPRPSLRETLMDRLDELGAGITVFGVMRRQ